MKNASIAFLALATLLPACGLFEKWTGGKSDNPEKGREAWNEPAVPAVEPVPFEQLVALLPKLQGWEGPSPEGKITASPGYKISSASAKYQRTVDGQNQVVSLAIVDGAYSSEAYGPFARMAYSNPNAPNMHKRGIEVDGNPGIEEWHMESKGVTVALFVARRFMFTLEGTGLPQEAVAEWMQGVDLKKLAALAGAGKPPTSGAPHHTP